MTFKVYYLSYHVYAPLTVKIYKICKHINSFALIQLLIKYNSNKTLSTESVYDDTWKAGMVRAVDVISGS